MSGFKAERILIANPYGIGDVLFTTPLVSTLRERFPESYIAFLTGSRTKEVLAANPEIDEIFVFDRDAFRAKPKLQAYRELSGLIQVLKKKRFNLYFDLSNTSMYGFLAFISGIRRRVGFNYKNRGRFLNYKMLLDGFEDKHVVEYYLSLLDFLPVSPVGVISNGVKLEKKKRTKFYLAAESEKWAEEFLASHNLKGSTLIGIHPWGGGSWGKTARFKWWPREKFLSLARILSEKYQAKIIVFSEPQLEVPARGRASATKLGGLLLTGQAPKELDSKSFVFPGELTLTQFAALIKKIHLLICNEGGPLQIAVAVGTPSVSIYGPVSEVVYGPYPAAKIHRIVSRGLSCQPCYRKFSFKPCREQKCLTELGVDEVLAEVEKALE